MTVILWSLLVMGVVAAVFGVVLAIAAHVFSVQLDTRQEEIEKHLAGANCGGCGYPGCASCAEAIFKGKAPVNACAPTGEENIRAIAAIMGVENADTEKKVSHMLCSGGHSALRRYTYVGLQDCTAASKAANGPLVCEHGCLGLGSCVAVCKFDAIRINERGVAEVDKDKCTNCGTCRAICPRHVIVEIPYDKTVMVNCQNPLKGAEAMRLCERSCIGCGLCAKICPNGALRMENNLPVFDFAKCTDCGLCAKACPRSAIEPVPSEEERKAFLEEQKK